MKWPSITVVDWSSFQSGVVDKIGIAPTLLRSYIYRGQADSAWTLRPSLARQFVEANISAKDALSIELRALSRFREKASEFVGVLAESSMGTIDWWTLMQHHGAPTSVLDWSHSIFVALYFAVTGKPDLDCAIWAVHQKSLMSLASARGGSANDELFTEAAITSEQPLKLLAQDRYRPTTRMLAQQGTFTVATHNLADQADAIHECFLRQKELESHPLKREASIGLK